MTRPAHPGEVLCEFIRAHGGRAIHFPTIAFAPTPDPVTLQQALRQLDQQDWLIFTSLQSVYSFKEAMCRYGCPLSSATQIAAIGAGTASALQAQGYAAVHYPPLNWNSEGLLALPALQAIRGKRMAIVRGAGGREWLSRALIERGAKLLSFITYQRTLPQVDSKPYAVFFEQSAIDGIIGMSYESVHNLKLLLGENVWPHLNKTPLIVISERIKALAQDLGFKTIQVAAQPTQAAILEVLLQLK